MSRFDEIRAANPELGFGLYAMEPGGAVTLEVYTPDGQVFSFAGPTQDSVLDQAFPAETLTIEPTAADPPPPEPNIFD